MDFDKEERRRIHAALRRYMRENRVGSPTMLAKIIDADDEHRHRVVSISTLQRFVADPLVKKDLCVELCYGFVKDLPYYGEGKDVAAFGVAAAEVFGKPEEGDGWQEIAAKLEIELAGRYETYAKPDFTGALAFPPEEAFRRSEIGFECVQDSRWLKVRERVSDQFMISLDADVDLEQRKREFLQEGIAVYASPQIHVFLRDVLTRQPKVYTLGKQVVKDKKGRHVIYEGHGYETTLGTGPRDVCANYFRIQVVRKVESAPKVEVAPRVDRKMN